MLNGAVYEESQGNICMRLTGAKSVHSRVRNLSLAFLLIFSSKFRNVVSATHAMPAWGTGRW
jgi:hypothetical protein